MFESHPSDLDIENLKSKVSQPEVDRSIVPSSHAMEPWRFKHEERTEEKRKIEKYTRFIEWGKEKGACLDKIEYPAAFGPKGELLGIAVAKDIAEGEAIMSIPASFRIDYSTIM